MEDARRREREIRLGAEDYADEASPTSRTTWASSWRPCSVDASCRASRTIARSKLIS